MLSCEFIFAQLLITTTASHSVCYGSSTILTVTASGGVPPYTYHWSEQTVDSSSITVSPISSTTYSVYVTDNNGNTSQTNFITLYVSPPIIFNIIANKDSICPGEQVLLAPVVSGGTGPPYVFHNQDGQIVTPPIFINPMYTGCYLLSIEDAFGCIDSSYACIYVMPSPPVGFLANPTSGCQPLTVNFNELYPVDGRTFVWDFGDMANLSLAHSPNHTYTDSGVYSVSLKATSSFGCITELTMNDLISVYPKPVANFNYHPIVSNANDTIDFSNLSQGASSYIWAFGDGDSSSIINPIHLFPNSGYWHVSLIAISDMGCSDTISTVITVNIDEVNLYNKIKCYPNPVFDKFTIESESLTNISLEILNSQGQSIKKIKLTNNVNNINLKELPKGLYIIRIYTDNGIIEKKLVKQ